MTNGNPDHAVYSAMRWNTPLSEAHADRLIERLDMRSATSVLDLGCGWGELLIRAVLAAGEDCAGVGVDTDDEQLARGRRTARERDAEHRVSFVSGEAPAWRQPADRVLCIGASHAWGGTAPTLAALAPVVAPGGRLVFGDGYWEADPTPEAVAIFGDEVRDLDGMVDQAFGQGWHVLSLTTADQRESDEFETNYRQGREEWLRANPQSAHAPALRRHLDERLREYVAVYRGVLGFAYLVLGR